MGDEQSVRQPVVSDTSPLIALATVGLLRLLPELYGEVLIPTVVREEFEAGRRTGESAAEDLDWLATVTVERDSNLPDALDPGEAAAISLAIRGNAGVILLDERLGRRVATELGLPIVGTMGVLLRAKGSGLIPAVRPVLDDLVARGLWVHPALVAQVLREAGEET